MRILDITCKDLTQLMRQRNTFLFFLIMPIAFTLLFGFAFGGLARVSLILAFRSVIWTRIIAILAANCMTCWQPPKSFAWMKATRLKICRAGLPMINLPPPSSSRLAMVTTCCGVNPPGSP